MRQGLSEERILDMPVNVFRLYCNAARRAEARDRFTTIANLTAGIGIAFGGKNSGKDFLSDLEYEMERD